MGPGHGNASGYPLRVAARATSGFGGQGGSSPAASGGAPYDVIQQPVRSKRRRLRQGGAGANGGGSIKLVVGGVMRVDGAVSANGDSATASERAAVPEAAFGSARKTTRAPVSSPPTAGPGSLRRAAAGAAAVSLVVYGVPLAGGALPRRQRLRNRWGGHDSPAGTATSRRANC